MSFADARRIADAVLYEGYVLYPYRASSTKNHFRFQFGVVAPRMFADAGGCERASIATELVVEGDDPIVRGTLRCLHLRRRTIEVQDGDGFRETDALDVDGQLVLAWDEAVEREVAFEVPRGSRTCVRFTLPGETAIELVPSRGRVLRRTAEIAGELRLESKQVDGGWLVRIAAENLTPHDDATLDRDGALRVALVGAHFMLAVEGGAFVSQLDPPEHAREQVSRLRNEGLFPVLVGREGARDTVLASPIVLYDWPGIAPESPGDFCDATEIDELLTLRTQTLTEAEKREARATDSRAAAIIERAEAMDGQALARLHGAIRSLKIPKVAKGTRVRLRPQKHPTSARRTDAQDMFLAGRIATVEDVREDVEGNGWIAVIVDDDPAAEMHRWYGRHLWFHPDELEPLEAS